MINPAEYRSGVGILLFNSKGLVFVGDRIEEQEECWQLPQGGIDEQENLETALLREAREEIGTDNFKIIKKTSDWLYYNLPHHISKNIWNGRYKGQKQIWFLCEFLGHDHDINISHHLIPEFSSWKWVDRKELIDLSVDFKKDVYRSMLSEFDPYF